MRQTLVNAARRFFGVDASGFFIDANANTAGINDAFAFIGSDPFTAAGQLRAFQSGAQWIVEGDINGDGVADLMIAVDGAATIGAGDFVP